MDDDVDMGELFDGSNQSKSRRDQTTSRRFAPKGVKFEPKVKAEVSQSQPPLAPNPSELLHEPKKEEFGVEDDVKPELGNDTMAMDVDVKSEVKTETDDDDTMETEPVGTPTSVKDEIVREIDVYFVPQVDPKTKLYLFQYPLRPLWRPHELEEAEVTMNPATSETEIHTGVDVEPKNYDPNSDPRVNLEKRIYKTKWSPHHTSHYAVGDLIGNKLYIHPLRAVVQLRPSLQHLDSKESKKKSNAVEGAVKSEQLNNIPEQDKDVGEEWITLAYRTAESELAQEYQEKLKSGKNSQINFTMHPSNYLDNLCPGPSKVTSSSLSASIRGLLELPLKERFKTWLIQGPPLHRFDALKYLAPDESDVEILTILQEYGRLVQGLWVAKSELVHGTDERSKILARDYILLQFSKSVKIKISHLSLKPRQFELMKEALNGLGVERQIFNDWKLKELPDNNFLRKYPQIVSKQNEEWIDTENKMSLIFGRKNVPMVSKGSSKVGTGTHTGATSITDMPEETRDAVTKALQKLFKSVNICRFQQIGKLLRDLAVSDTGFAKEAMSAASIIDTHPKEFEAILKEVAVNIHGICVRKSSPEQPQFDAFRRVVIGHFLGNEPNAKLKKATIFEAAKMSLQRNINNNEYKKVMEELCLYRGGSWILRSGD
ncbi:uncharacterized protein LOC127248602 [Andrographis paniculata]|uniref:uncharacterized protein LOC127248602 n=1 Tax=Andrographis paniculata TaxID=175694 RepID=UPI0021E72914|nr:uncharacterized protein LOC127248602 [Andrographis paniculata]